MLNKMQRQDPRRTRRSQCYTIPEVSNLLGVSIGTVSAWLRRGLSSLEGERPILIPGDELKSWLVAERQARKRKCLPDEFYCCRCRLPRKAKLGTVVIIPRNAKTIAISALCGTCDARMNRGGSLAKLPQIRIAFGLITQAQVNLAGCEILMVVDPALPQMSRTA